MNNTPEKRYFVYGLIDPRDQSLFYVGVTCRLGRRMKEHKSSKYLSAKVKMERINTLLENGLDFTYRIFADDLTLEGASELETFLILKFGKIVDGTGILTNVKEGSYVGRKRGFRMSQEEKLKRSLIMKAKKLKHSKEHLEKRFAKARSKKVLQIDPKTDEVIKVWNTAAEAQIAFGRPRRPHIYGVCTGRIGWANPLKTAFGFKWKYEDPEKSIIKESIIKTAKKLFEEVKDAELFIKALMEKTNCAKVTAEVYFRKIQG